MGRIARALGPSLNRALTTLGQNIRLARLRRQFSATLIAARAGVSIPTLRAIEDGDPKVSLGAYAMVLLSLGLEQDIASIAKDDALGRKLQDAGLETKLRAPKRPQKPDQKTALKKSTK